MTDKQSENLAHDFIHLIENTIQVAEQLHLSSSRTGSASGALNYLTTKEVQAVTKLQHQLLASLRSETPIPSYWLSFYSYCAEQMQYFVSELSSNDKTPAIWLSVHRSSLSKMKRALNDLQAAQSMIVQYSTSHKPVDIEE